MRKFVLNAHKSRKNRVYYEKCFTSLNLFENGLIQDEQKSSYDQVVLDESRNEFIRFYAFDQSGSHFDLSLSILSLYPQVSRGGSQEESRWRLASVQFTYIDLANGCRYTYEAKQLIDYTEKRKTSASHESRNIYKVGSLSLEIVLPFSLSRIVFNGYLSKSPLNKLGVSELISSKLTISTHPNCDKYDYQYRFDPEYVVKALQDAGTSKEDCQKHLELLLEDRVDMPMMFQVCLEKLDQVDITGSISVPMWGAKIKRFIESSEIIRSPLDQKEPKEDLFIWSKVGHQFHLTRPLKEKSLINGMVNSSFDYASQLFDLKLMVVSPQEDTGKQKAEERQMQQKSFKDLESFANLKPGMEIHLRAFTSKEYNIKIMANCMDDKGLLEVDLNGFEGWAICRNHDGTRALKEAQCALWAVDIHDRKFAFPLATESLLGGKGNSLIDLNRLVELKIFSDDRPSSSRSKPKSVSVPRGVVVSCVAYQLWLKSNPLIEKSIEELDNTRRALSARSVFTNPLSDKYMPLAQSQQILREQSKKTCLLLNSCPLPPVLVKHLRTLLLQIFTHDELKNPPKTSAATASDDDYDEDKEYKKFAVRSSAVGEDSLDTSAAGQMRTILDARGFDAIIRSIVECWSSQFEPEAIMYKSQNGLDFNLPMAVVVQELIQCQVAGVATTCDSLTGSKSKLQILANLGLGEGVVSGNKTDTICLSLESLGWNQATEEHVGFLSQTSTSRDEQKKPYTVISDSKIGGDVACCLNDEQIVALGNVLICLRRHSGIRDREVEWGITPEETGTADLASSSSSSSSSSESPREDTLSRFNIHLLQSRPLTHLFKLSSREIDHELDYGFASPINIVSRANLGEVMPGALCPLTSTYFMPICTNLIPEKPFNENHTVKPFAATSFAFHAQLVCMVLTYTDTMTRFGASLSKDEDAMSSDQRTKDRSALLRTMIGTTDDPNFNEEMRLKLTKERINPMSKMKPSKLVNLIALDSGLYLALYYRMRRRLDNAKFTSDLTSIESYIDQLESTKYAAATVNGSYQQQQQQQQKLPITAGKQSILDNIERDIRKLFNRLMVKTVGLLGAAWGCHIRATMLNMALNMICMKILTQQPGYPDSVTSTEILNDFSTLMQGGQKTESGNISSLLSELIEALIEEGKFDLVRKMNHKELYNFLISSSATSKGAVLFNEFMQKNGHRSFKEFDFSTLTWADDPSYIIKSLASRLKLFKLEDAEKERQAAKQRIHEQEEKAKHILETKVQNSRAFLTKYILPRCRNGTVRREGSKSLLIETISKFRNAFRHLGGLLCLAGRLPDAKLISQLAIEELESIVNLREGSRADLSRILYKCRRRQQRARVLNQITYPTPTLGFNEMIEHMKQCTGETQQQQQQQHESTTSGPENAPRVCGITSCAGRVTGRACVVRSLDDMDQIQPNDILITYSIDISWSVYFFTLAGIVTEIGGIVSHGAVVAREYGIPTLCTAIGACSIFKTGQMVTLDANQGICYLATASDADGAAADSAEVSSTLPVSGV